MTEAREQAREPEETIEASPADTDTATADTATADTATADTATADTADTDTATADTATADTATADTATADTATADTATADTATADTATADTATADTDTDTATADTDTDTATADTATADTDTDTDTAEPGALRDVLPDDLNASEFVGVYMFPNNNRRRIPGVLYLLIGLGFVLLWLLVADSPMVNAGFAWGGVALVVVGLYNLVAGWNLSIDENDALVAATRTVGFPVGHASAQLGWRGWLSRPTWRILLYSNEAQPERRGLVLIDGNDGEVLDTIVEKNPEDWSHYV